MGGSILRKILIAVWILLVAGLIHFYIYINVKETGFKEKPAPSENNLSLSSKSAEKMNYDILTALVHGHVRKAVSDWYRDNSYYGSASADPWQIKILKVDKAPDAENDYQFYIKTEVEPYINAHNKVGLDIITLKIDLNGIKVEKYEHLKTYELNTEID